MYTHSKKHEFIRLRLSGMTIRQIAKEMGINPSTAMAWNREFGRRIREAQFEESEKLMRPLDAGTVDRLQSLGRQFNQLDKFVGAATNSRDFIAAASLLLKVEKQLNAILPINPVSARRR